MLEWHVQSTYILLKTVGKVMTTKGAEVQGNRWKGKMQMNMSITCMPGMQRTYVR